MRLDNYLFLNKYFDSRTKAKQAIERGEIFLNGKVITKSSYEVAQDFTGVFERKAIEDFVSLGGYKLSKALCDFNFSVDGLIIADIGASTGGFTDCLLQNGAKKVYAVDLNEFLLHPKLKNNENVKLIVKNAKELSLEDFSEKLDLIVADLSFISITALIEVFDKLLTNQKHLLVLIKPQFETGGKKKYKNGIIRDKKVQLDACYNVYEVAQKFGFYAQSFTSAPINNEKNIEFLMLFEKNGQNVLQKNQITF